MAFSDLVPSCKNSHFGDSGMIAKYRRDAAVPTVQENLKTKSMSLTTNLRMHAMINMEASSNNPMTVVALILCFSSMSS